MNLLCLIAHPDDETILCGGTLAMLASKGVAVHVACLTRGEGGELGEPPLTDREHIGEVREQELVCAVQKLGGKSLTFLGYIDPLMKDSETLYAPEHSPTLLAGQIVSTIKQFKIDAVLTHGSNGEYGHPAHILTHQMTLAAVASIHKESSSNDSPFHLFIPSPLLYSFSASFLDHPYPRLLNKDDAADLILDVSPYLGQKESAALCHKTQMPVFVRRRSEMAGKQLTVREVMLTVESLHRIFGSEEDELSKLLKV
jgi:LmbE family N-acetylglucosaminyl deacetylase